jgi:hypothetical protein
MKSDSGMNDLQVTETGEKLADWACDNCGTMNTGDLSHCKGCAYRKDFRSEEFPNIDFSALQKSLDSSADIRFRTWHSYLTIAKDALLLIFVIFAFAMGMRLNANWPFETPYQRDARILADELLSLHVAVDMGITKQEYKDQLVLVMAEKTKFDVMYKDTALLQHTSFQKLKQAAEYFELADETWSAQLSKEAVSGRNSSTAVSRNADADTQKYWQTASSNLMLAIEDM